FRSSPRPLCHSLFPYTTLFRSPDGIRIAPRIDPVLDRQAEIALVEETEPQRQRQFFDREQPARPIGIGPPPHLFFHVIDIVAHQDRKSTRLNSSHVKISYAVFC